MADELTIRISATDDASKVFSAIAKTAKTVADSLEEAGKEGDAGFKRVKTGADSAKASLLKLDSTGTGVIRTFDNMGSAAEKFASGLVKTGSGLETVGRTIDKIGQSYLDQERQISVLNRMYGEQAERILDASDALQDYSVFSDDAARQSMVTLNTLNENYGLSIDNLETLLTRAADVATAHGRSLEEVSQMFQNAIRGEAEYAEAVGITLNDNYVAAEAARRGIEGWTTSMTDAEKAAFRFQLIMEQTSTLEGYGGEYAQTMAGRVRQLGNELQDAAQQAGAFVGPWGQIIGETGGGLATLGQAAEGIREVVAGLKLLKSAAASGIGTFGLVGAAVGVASYGLVKMIGNINDLKSASAALDRLDIELEVNAQFDKQQMLQGVRDTFADAADWLEDANGPFALNTGVPNAIKAKIGQVFAEAFSDPSVDSDAFSNWFNAQVAGFRANNDDLGLSQFFASLDTSTLDQFRSDVDAASDSVENMAQVAKAAAADVKNIFQDLPSTIDDLRIDGNGALANDLEKLGKAVQETFAPTYKGMSTDFAQDGWGAIAQSSIDASAITEESATRLDAAWDRISTKMQTGALDNAAVMQDVFAVLNNTSLNADQKVAEIEKISHSLGDYVDRFAELKDAQAEWLANGRNFLNWWQEYDTALARTRKGMADTATDMEKVNAALAQQKTFRLDVEIASGVQDASEALDQVLRTFGEIDALGQRSAASGSIADNLIGDPGELGALQDLWDRIAQGTSDAALSQEVYNQAIESGIAIQESNVRVQDDLNVIRAKQMPLLQQEQEAYEANIARIADLNAEEGRRVLLLQDSAVQSQIASLYSQAYAASIGEIPKEAATKMILEAAEADAGLKDLLLNLGLISETDGEIHVNFPDAESVGSSIDRVTKALLYMQGIAEHKSAYEIAVELYGEEEANRLFNRVDAADGKTATMNVTVLSTGVDEAGNKVQTLKLADGTTVTVLVGVDGLGDLTKADSDLKAVQLADGTVVTVKTEVDTTGWEDSTIGDLINNGTSVEVETVLKPPTGWTTGDWNASEGPLPSIEVDTKAKPLNETPEYTGGPVDVPVTFAANATVGDGTGGPLAGMSGLEQQEFLVTLGLVDNASQGIGDVQSAIDNLPKSTEVSITAATSDAIGSIGAVTESIGLVPKATDVTVSALTGSSVADVLAVSDAIAGVDSKTVYINVITAYSSTGSPSGFTGNTYVRHGGVPGYAMGGVLFEAGEAGAELAHFAGGGTALIPSHGLYMAPPGTYIEPANSVATKLSPGMGMGGPLVYIENITVGAGASPADAQVIADQIVDRLDRAIEHRLRGGGLSA